MKVCFAVVISNNTTRATRTVEAHSDGSKILWLFGTLNWALEVCKFWICFAKHKPQEQQIKPPGQQPQASEQRGRQGKARHTGGLFWWLGLSRVFPGTSFGPKKSTQLLSRTRRFSKTIARGCWISPRMQEKGMGKVLNPHGKTKANHSKTIAKPLQTITNTKAKPWHTIANHCKTIRKP